MPFAFHSAKSTHSIKENERDLPGTEPVHDTQARVMRRWTTATVCAPSGPARATTKLTYAGEATAYSIGAACGLAQAPPRAARARFRAC